MSATLFQYIDSITQQVVVYEDERERWLENQHVAARHCRGDNDGLVFCFARTIRFSGARLICSAWIAT
jgi:hypothetical protein